jgi:hypothetical protein
VHAPVHGEGGTDREGPQRIEREKGRTGNDSAPDRTGPRGRERRGTRVGEATGADRSAPAGRGRERERERVGQKAAADRRARGLARPSWAGFPFSFSLDFLIPFSVSFL